MKKTKYEVEFYINPQANYDSHKLNVLKECLSEWIKKDNSKFYPNWKEFKFEFEEIEIHEGHEIMVLHCYTTWDWVSEHDLFDEITHLNSFFEN